MTIHDVAKKANVSISTVSRVINNKHNVREQTKSKVIDAIKELRFFPNAAARSLIHNKTHNLALVISDIANPSYSDLIKGVQFIANQDKYAVFLFDAEEKAEKELNILDMLFEKRIDGIMIAAPRVSNRKLIEFANRKIPMVLYNRGSKNKDLFSIMINDSSGAFRAVSYLIELGHRRIGFITGPIRSESCHAKYKGYKAALKRYGLDFDGKLVAIGDATPKSGFKAMEKLLLLERPPTAIFVYDDYSAFGVYECIYKKGMQIPRDLSVIGSDDIFYARFLDPPLTTLNIPYYKIGTRLARTIISFLKGTKQIKRKIFIDPELKIRGSTIRPN